MLKFIPAVAFLLALWSTVAAQNSPESHHQHPVFEFVEAYRNNGAVFSAAPLFKSATPAAEHKEALQFAPGAQLLTLDEKALRRIAAEPPETVSFDLPFQGDLMRVDLVRVEIETPDFTVITSVSNGQPVPHKSGAHYRGIVRGEEHSVAAVSFFDGEMMGLIVDEAHGNLSLGRLENRGNLRNYICYADQDVAESMPSAQCEALEHDEVKKKDSPTAHLAENSKCVRVYFEVDHALFNNKGASVQATSDYVTAMFNQCAALYAKEQINTKISQIFVWETPDSYSTTSSSAALNQFRSQRTSFNGDLAHLVGIAGNNLGGVAYVGVLCSRSYAYAYSDIHPSFSNVPTFSWTVQVVTHEMGHNLGSPHTQSCSWPGGAIDNCVSTEGGCAPGPAPSGGGTIMSYCHLTGYGINFNNGFGKLPGDKIRGHTAGATCLTTTCDNTGGGGGGGGNGGGGGGGGTPCAIPAGLSVASINSNSAIVSWNTASGATAYELRYRVSGGATWNQSKATSPFRLSNLTPNTEYEVSVRTVCGTTTSDFSANSKFRTSTTGGGGGGGGGTSCGAPANLQASSTPNASIVSWNTVAGATGYQVVYKAASASAWSAPATVNTPSYLINGLTPATAYEARVTAVCGSATSTPENVSFTTQNSNTGSTCNPPSNLTATPTPSSITVSWSAISGSTQYQLSYKAAGTTTWSTPQTVSGTTQTLTNLIASTTYNIRVTAVCGANTSTPATVDATTQQSTGACPAPSGLRPIMVLSTMVVISWNPVPNASSYVLQIKSGAASNWTTFRNVTATRVQIRNLAPGRPYQLRVAANCPLGGLSTYTPILNFTTAPVRFAADENDANQTTGSAALIDGSATGTINELYVSPNPATDQAAVTITTGDGAPAKLDIFDLHGRIVRLTPFTLDNTTVFPLQELPSGIYFVRATLESGEVLTKRLVKT